MLRAFKQSHDDDDDDDNRVIAFYRWFTYDRSKLFMIEWYLYS